VHNGLCCLKGRKKGGKGLLDKTSPTEDAIGGLLGPNVKVEPYTSAGDNPQDSCDALSCNFESSCCWTNALPPADLLNWAQGSGQPDADKMQKHFKTSSVPDGNFIVTASATPGNEAQTAQFYSCPITCSNSDITVKLKHWATDTVKIQVCTEQDPAGPPENCQDLPTENGNQDTVTVPKGENQRIVIQATGFTAPTGSGAMVSNIEVACDPCGGETSAAPTPAPPAETPGPTASPSTICQDIPCNFEDGSLCKYQAGGSANQNWHNDKNPFHNRLTGVPKESGSKSFAASYLKAKKGEKSTLTSIDTNFDKDYVVRCKYHNDVDGVSFKGCCNDDANCPFDSKDKVEVKDYQTWKTASFTCPTGTKKVVFVADNVQGANEGAVAVDDIDILEPASPPDSASQSVCGGDGGGNGNNGNHGEGNNGNGNGNGGPAENRARSRKQH